MNWTVNPDRGEVGLPLAGNVYPMLPTLTAVNAIEAQLGSVYWLSMRIILQTYFPTFNELAVIAAECIRAAGKDRGEKMLEVSTEKIAEMLFEEGLNDEVTHPICVTLLGNMIRGGAKKKAGAAASPPPSAQTGSNTAS